MKILVADDDPQILRTLRITLTALDSAIASHPDLVVLDLGMPGLTGIEVIQGMRGWSQVPILVVSGRSESWDKVEALDAGADDYMTKPFSTDELLARIRVLGRHTPTASDEPIVTFGEVSVDLSAHLVTRAGHSVRLTPTEWRLLEVLIRNPDKLVTHETLLTEAWGPQYTSDTGYIRLFISQLRKKLESEPSAPRYLLTQQGLGYRFTPNPSD
jgi:two-component system KDP operon response regulator KdpE